MVDGLEKRLEGTARTARVDIMSERGGALADRFHCGATPTYLVLDGNGKVAYRQVGGSPNVDAILARAKELRPRSP